MQQKHFYTSPTVSILPIRLESGICAASVEFEDKENTTTEVTIANQGIDKDNTLDFSAGTTANKNGWE